MPMRDEISTPHLPRFSEENHINFGWESCEYMNKQATWPLAVEVRGSLPNSHL